MIEYTQINQIVKISILNIEFCIPPNLTKNSYLSHSETQQPPFLSPTTTTNSDTTAPSRPSSPTNTNSDPPHQKPIHKSFSQQPIVLKHPFQTTPSLPPACTTSHSEPRPQGHSSFFNFLTPRNLFSTISSSMPALASSSPLDTKKLSKYISNTHTNPPSKIRLSKDISKNSYLTPRNLRKRKPVCYRENGSTN